MSQEYLRRAGKRQEFLQKSQGLTTFPGTLNMAPLIGYEFHLENIQHILRKHHRPPFSLWDENFSCNSLVSISQGCHWTPFFWLFASPPSKLGRIPVVTFYLSFSSSVYSFSQAKRLFIVSGVFKHDYLSHSPYSLNRNIFLPVETQTRSNFSKNVSILFI